MDVLLIFIYVIVVFLVLYQMSLELEDKLEEKVEIVVEEKTLAEQTQEQLSLQPNPRHIKAHYRDMTFGGKKGDKKKINRPVLTLLFDTDQKFPIDPLTREMQKQLGYSEEMIQDSAYPNKVIVRVAPTNEQPLRAIPFVSVIVQNETQDMQVYLDWDSSSIEMMKQGNRVIRATPNVPVDLSQRQVPTVANPGMTVTSSITAEKRFSRNNPDNALISVPSQPIFDLREIVALSRMTDPTAAKENIQPLYSLDLKVLIKHRAASNQEFMHLLVPFIFKVKIKVDEPAFPPMRWWLRKFGRNRPKKGNWFWGSRPPMAKGD